MTEVLITQNRLVVVKLLAILNNFFIGLRRWLGEKFIFLDKDSIQHNETAQILAGPTKLPIKSLTNACRLLLDKLAICAPSSRKMRELIKSYFLQMDEPFDLSIHADLNFTEVMCTHL